MSLYLIKSYKCSRSYTSILARIGTTSAMTMTENGKMEREENNMVTTSEKHSRKSVRHIVGRVFEVGILAVVIAAVWGLFSLPTVFFFHKANMLPIETQNISNHFNGTTALSLNSQSLPKPSAMNMTCATDFYLDTEAGFCKPECGQWKPFSDGVVVANTVIVIMSSVVGIAGGILIVTISILKNRQMFKFPSILILYQYTSIALFLFVNIIGIMDTQTFLCPSRDATESFRRTTPYCTFYGISLYYLLIQAGLLWVEHIATVLGLVAFPFKSKQFETSKYQKILHILMLVIALVLPIGFTVAPLATGGFRPFYYPNPCVSSNSNTYYYTLILPLSIVPAVGNSLLVLLFWILIRRKWMKSFTALSTKNTGLFQKHGTQRSDTRNSTIPTTAVVKVSLSFLCYGALTTFGNVAATFFISVQSQYAEELTEYFICESSGVSSDKVCERTYEALYNPFPTTVVLFLLGICWPSISLLYVINLKQTYIYIKRKATLSTAANPVSESI